MEDKGEERKEEKKEDKELIALYETRVIMWFLGSIRDMQLKEGRCYIKKWKPGPKKDRIRLNRVRSIYTRYHPALDIKEIYEKIVGYLDPADPADVVNFARALETLGCRENLEGLYLKRKIESWGYTSRVSIGLMRKKILGGFHCNLCGERNNLLDPAKNMKRNTITNVPTCWKCMNKKYKLIDKKKAIELFMGYNASMPMPDILAILSPPPSHKCKHGPEGHLRYVKYSHRFFYLKKDVMEAKKNWLARQVEDAMEEDGMVQTRMDEYFDYKK